MIEKREITLTIKGRGAAHNPPNRFDPIALEPDGDFIDSEDEQLPTQTVYYKDTARTIGKVDISRFVFAETVRTDYGDIGRYECGKRPIRACLHACLALPIQ